MSGVDPGVFGFLVSESLILLYSRFCGFLVGEGVSLRFGVILRVAFLAGRAFLSDSL